jgi:hypothetical protein
MKKELELRMYFLVMYNLSDIQKGIQAGHAAIEYGNFYGGTKLYKKWAVKHKTFVILNGGTSNDGVVSCFGENPDTGTMQSHEIEFQCNGITYATFREPDANSALTAIAIIIDERVFNHKDFPDFMGFCKDKLDAPKWLSIFKNGPITPEEMEEALPELFAIWVESIGGRGNAFLKYFLPPFRLA